MRMYRGLVSVVAVAWIAAAGQQVYDPEDVLERTRERLLADLARLPHYTCVQTITRRYSYAAGPPRSCAELIAAHDQRTGELKTRAWDRLRLDVAIVEGNSVFSWAGASQFDEDNIEELAGRGPLGSGDFGSFLDSIFRYALIHFRKEEAVQGRVLLEYDYEMPEGRSGYMVRAGSEWVATAYSGTVVLDPETADIVKLAVRTAELPKANPGCQANSEITYQRTSIHDRMILIPQETRLNAINRDGTESLGVTAYESCREYASKSRVLASAPTDTATGSAAQNGDAAPLSPDLRFQCRIVTAIDSDTAAAGDPVEAVLRSPLHDKKRNLSIPAGARLHGRLLQMEHRSGTFDTVRLSVQWDSITAGGREIPLRAQPDVLSASGYISIVSSDSVPYMRSFVFRQDRLRLQQFDWNWTTVAESDDKNSPGSSSSAGQTTPRLHTIEITDGEFSIEAASGVDFKLSVPAGASNVRVEGAFNATGGSPNDVAVSLFSSEEFQRWRNREPAKAVYASGPTGQGNLNVALPAAAGVYFLVFSNHFPLSTPKVVQASVRLHYKL